MKTLQELEGILNTGYNILHNETKDFRISLNIHRVPVRVLLEFAKKHDFKISVNASRKVDNFVYITVWVNYSFVFYSKDFSIKSKSFGEFMKLKQL
jgi:hypothetical protein